MNEHDSLKMAALLLEQGWSRTISPESADLLLFNTCTIRKKPEHKAMSELGRALKLKKKRPDLIVAITGCVAQQMKDELYRRYPQIDIVLGPDQVHAITKHIDRAIESRANNEKIRCNATELINNSVDYKFIETPSIIAEQSKVSQFITIMKGCNNFCSYCIVPYVRGREVSRSPQRIVQEIILLTEKGINEIVLLGQNVNSYGKDNEEFGTFTDLIKNISDNTSIKRIRYVSPHPKDFSDDLILEHKKNPKLCPHIHLPVQSGSTTVLKRMNRGYTRDDYLKLVTKLKHTIPNLAITTDIIVGFSGETEQEFNDTFALLNEIEFCGMFSFKYSPREGTLAAKKYPDNVPDNIKLERLHKILELNEKIVLKKNLEYVGTNQEVLVEGPSRKWQNQLTGRNLANTIVNFQGEQNLIGTFANININHASINSLRGERV